MCAVTTVDIAYSCGKQHVNGAPFLFGFKIHMKANKTQFRGLCHEGQISCRVPITDLGTVGKLGCIKYIAPMHWRKWMFPTKKTNLHLRSSRWFSADCSLQATASESNECSVTAVYLHKVRWIREQSFHIVSSNFK